MHSKLFADDIKMATPRKPNMNLQSSLVAIWDLLINPAKCNYHTIGREVSLGFSFFPGGCGTPTTVSKLVKDLGVQTDNAFSPSAQCTEAANKTKLDLHDYALLPRSFEIDLHPILRGLSVSTL